MSLEHIGAPKECENLCGKKSERFQLVKLCVRVLQTHKASGDVKIHPRSKNQPQ